ncbi:MAG TPA: site-specific integrase [Desulfatiglandales bacterium]|nr:site-specific integrase [Desulfatiglandales bacterium]
MRNASKVVKQIMPGVFGYDFTFNKRRYRKYFRGLSKEQVQTIYLGELDKQRRKKYGLDEIEPLRPIRFEDFSKEYLENYAEKKKSRKSYHYQVDRLKKFFSGKMLNSITIDDIEAYQKERAREVSNSTVNRELACLSGIFTYAIKKRRISYNPVRQVERDEEEPKERRALTDDEVERLLSVIEESESPYLRAFVKVMLNTGMRPSEILSLRWKDIDFTNRFIRIKNSKTDKKNNIKRKGRDVPLNGIAGSAIRSIKKTHDYIFFNPRSKGRVKGVKRSFMTACDKAKIKGVTPYCLRHTVATKLVNELGVDIVTAGRILGHSKVEMTLRYCHPSKETVQKAAFVLGDFWSKNSAKNTIEPLLRRRVNHSYIYN